METINSAIVPIAYLISLVALVYELKDIPSLHF
jgi:hypothetical protein